MDANNLTQQLFEKNLITATQYEQVKSHRAARLFSLRREILFLFLVSVLMFCAGTGIIIYKNIDTIGHVVILALLLILTVVCFYISFKHFPGYSPKKVVTEKPVYDYLVLAANLLTAIFIAYLHQQYEVFKMREDLATLIPTALFFFSAYYFDHRGLLSMGITGLCTFVGFSVTPTGIFHSSNYNDVLLAYYAVVLAATFIGLSIYSEKGDLKKHFVATYENFALHISSVSGIVILVDDFWYPGLLFLGLSLFYFYRVSQKRRDIQMLVFTLLYAFVAITILLFKFIMFTQIFGEVLVYLSPLYFLAAILFFVKYIRELKNRSRHESI